MCLKKIFYAILIAASMISYSCSTETVNQMNNIPVPVCGNGTVETGETCDDGNTVTERCAYGETACQVCNGSCNFAAGEISFCGDGVPDGSNGEGCDDSNISAGDGCDADCKVETANPVCGNGSAETGEGCDDGNTSTESCVYGEASCTVCDASCNFTVGAVTGFCGDGTVNGTETCDDNNAVTESCAYGETSCTVCDASCNLTVGAVTGFCGDGTVNGPETCDDNNVVTESCAYGETSCSVCDASCNLTAGAVIGYCGDGTVNGTETCDDNNVVTESCAYGETSCTVCAASCNLMAGALTGYCGDGIIDGSNGEGCDDSNITAGDGCDADCKIEAAIPVCGNGAVETGETCDDSNTITESCAYGETSCTVCDSTCNLTAGAVTGHCGDGTVNGTETCDDNNVVTESCAYGETSCTVCDSNCSSAAGAVSYCGDGFIDNTNGEACDSNGADNLMCIGSTCQYSSCGDGYINAATSEQCDTNGTDTVSCNAGTCLTSLCGDGYANGIAGEQCDTSGIDTDVCNAGTCQLSECGDGYSNAAASEQCDTSGTDTNVCNAGTCLTSLCGDGYANAADSEECDDGNALDTDACLNTCTAASCGDGYIYAGVEQCDNSGTDNAVCIGSTCQFSSCGDGYVNGAAGEQCDTNGTDTVSCNAGTCLTSSCGDGYANAAASEQCDTNGTDTVSCNAGTCLTSLCGDGYANAAAGEQCDTSGTDTVSCNAGTCLSSSCGDGYANAADSEECDDGNALDTDACLNTCTVASCGDGYIYAGVEQCDNSGADNAVCIGSTCQFSSCGDGYVNGAAGEDCDTSSIDTAMCNGGTCRFSECGDGYENTADGEACDSVTDTVSCNAGTCLTSLCGDGYANVAASEECDTSGIDTVSCNASTCLSSSCGDGYANAAASEECDTSGIDTVSCNAGTCLSSSCGDGYINAAASEQCDDGNILDTDNCLNTCVAASCGDGFVNAGVEDCDDSNTVTEVCNYGDIACTVCDSSCASIAGVTSYCGDSALDAGNGEECDDGGIQTSTCEADCKTRYYNIGVTVSNLSGIGLVLQNNGGDNINILSDGFITFSTGMQYNDTYNVTILTQPTDLNQTCTITNGTGTVTSDVTDITLDCTPYLMGGSVQGSAISLLNDVTTIAGNFPYGLPIDDVGLNAKFGSMEYVASDGTNIYVADTPNHTIRKIEISTNTVTTYAGSAGISGSTDNIGTNARFNAPRGLVKVGSSLYVCDANNHTIRRINLASGAVTTIAGSVGISGSANGTGTAATFSFPTGIASDGTNLYVISAKQIRQIVISSAVVTTLAGSSATGSVDGVGVAASFNLAYGIIHAGGNLYVADTYNDKIRKIEISSATVSTFAGTGTYGFQDGTGTTAVKFARPYDIATDGTYLYVTDSASPYSYIRKIEISSAVVTTIGGKGGGYKDGTGYMDSIFYEPKGVVINGTDLYIADSSNRLIRKIDTTTNTSYTIAGTLPHGSNDGIGTNASFRRPDDVTTDGKSLYITDFNNHIIRKMDIVSGQVSTLAGKVGVSGSLDGIGSDAIFSAPKGITTDGTYLYVADNGSHVIRKIDIATAQVTTIAGWVNSAGYANATGTSAKFNYISGITTDKINLYVADTSNRVIRKVDLTTYDVTTFAGADAPTILSGDVDNVDSTLARFNNPYKITTDGTNLFVADLSNNKIRKINIATRAVSTLAGLGSGNPGSIDGDSATAKLNMPYGITSDGASLFVVDTNGPIIREIDIATGYVTTIAGTAGVFDYVDANGSFARFYEPKGITTDGTSLYLVDYNTIRKID
ncbi:MAG: DUF4215 domain-containing protein [Spirochaetia bacterium]|nr:DUF4215 domain-containing protein [Spirochaetia bacterium]